MSTTEMPRPGAMLFQIHLPACHAVTRRPTLLDIKQLHLMACLGDTLVWWGASLSKHGCVVSMPQEASARKRVRRQHIDIDLPRHLPRDPITYFNRGVAYPKRTMITERSAITARPSHQISIMIPIRSDDVALIQHGRPEQIRLWTGGTGCFASRRWPHDPCDWRSHRTSF